MDGRKKQKTAKWYEAIAAANRARRGIKCTSSPTRSGALRRWWREHPKKAAKLRKERRDRWKNKDFRKKQVDAMHSERALQKSSESKRKWWSKNKLRMQKIRKVQANRPEERKRLSAIAKANWANPVTRKRMVLARKKQATSPEEIARKKRVAEAKWADPEYRKKQRDARKTMYNAKWRAKVSAGCKGRKPWNKGLTKDTDERLMKVSKQMRGRIPDYNKFRCWYPNDKIKKIRMRSSWEVGYALYLDKRGTKWEYEPRYFNVGKGIGSFVPDFYLPEKDVYVELKGWQSEEGRRKIRAFRERHPEIELYVLRKERLCAMGIIDKHGVVKVKK